MKNISDDICLFAIQAIRTVVTLQKLTKADLSANATLPLCDRGEFAGVKRCDHAPPQATPAPEDLRSTCIKTTLKKYGTLSFLKAGKRVQHKQPIGLWHTREGQRLEMGFCLYGNDIDDNSFCRWKQDLMDDRARLQKISPTPQA